MARGWQRRGWRRREGVRHSPVPPGLPWGRQRALASSPRTRLLVCDCDSNSWLVLLRIISGRLRFLLLCVSLFKAFQKVDYPWKKGLEFSLLVYAILFSTIPEKEIFISNKNLYRHFL